MLVPFIFRRRSLAAVIFFLGNHFLFAQVGIGTNTPDSSAILHLESQDRGFLVPRMTTVQQLGINNPAMGLMVFNTDSLRIYYYDGNYWLSFAQATGDTVRPWRCGDPFKDTRDDQYYATVEIGTQCWMAENLNTGTRIDGSQAMSQQFPEVIEKYCYNDTEDSCDIYGGLYPWNEMMQYVTTAGAQGICPDGWHLPTDAEWKILEGSIDNLYGIGDPEWNKTSYRGFDAGGKLKETGTEHWESPNTGATENNNFRALPGGAIIIYSGGHFYSNIRYGCTFWTSSALDEPEGPICRDLMFDEKRIQRSVYNGESGVSVRCIKDDNSSNQPPSVPSGPGPGNNDTGIGIDTMLTWTCTDSENDALSFAIYFDDDPDPGYMLVGSVSDTMFVFPYNLFYNTTYYWKVVAFDTHGYSTSGPVWSFTTMADTSLTGDWTCGDSLKDTRDNKKYPTVLIGTQCWMAENLNLGTRIDGSQNQSQQSPDIIEKYCYNDLEDSCDIYGGLYQWEEMMRYLPVEGGQGICPGGWHIPTLFEWTILISTHGGESVAGGKMKETGYRYWLEPNEGGTNESGFSARGGGWRNWFNGSYMNARIDAYIWSSTPYADYGSFHKKIFYNQSSIGQWGEFNTLGASVRCIQNDTIPNQPPQEPTNPQPEDNSTNIGRDTLLTWSCSDPDNEPLIYEIYFGSDPEPSLIRSRHGITSYNPGSLDYEVTYYWKIIAVDPWYDSTSSPVWSFTTMADTSNGTGWKCGDPFTDARDGQTYGTTLIGSQCWMSENLNIGDPINSTNGQTQQIPEIIEKYCYDDNVNNCDVYGGLYQWNEMMQYITTEGVQGICPDGWHIPTDAEWKVLEGRIDSQFGIGYPEWDNIGDRGYDAGGNLKETGTTHWQSPNTFATDNQGFTALPAGYCVGAEYWGGIEQEAYFWTSTEEGISNAYERWLIFYNAAVFRDYGAKNFGFSVRCIKD